MFTPPNQAIFDQWNRFLIDAELARKYEVPYQLYARQHLPVPRNPILERLLPSLLYVRLCAILDDALQCHIRTKKLKLPTKDKQGKRFRFQKDSQGNMTRADLDSCIRLLGEGNLLQDSNKLQTIRGRRNDIAHKIDQSATWEEFWNAVSCVEGELQHLGFVGKRPRISVYGFSAGGDPVPPQSAIKRRDIYSWGLRIDGKKVKCFSWQIDIPHDGNAT